MTRPPAATVASTPGDTSLQRPAVVAGRAPTGPDRAIRDLLCLQLRAIAALQMQMAAALIDKGQDDLRRHFTDSAELMIKAHRELAL